MKAALLITLLASALITVACATSNASGNHHSRDASAHPYP